LTWLGGEAPDVDSLFFLATLLAMMHPIAGLTQVLWKRRFGALVVAIVYGVYRFMSWREMKPPKVRPTGSCCISMLCWRAVHLFSRTLPTTTAYVLLRRLIPSGTPWDIVFIVDPIMLAALFLGCASRIACAGDRRDWVTQTPVFADAPGAILPWSVWRAVIFVRDS